MAKDPIREMELDLENLKENVEYFTQMFEQRLQDYLENPSAYTAQDLKDAAEYLVMEHRNLETYEVAFSRVKGARDDTSDSAVG